MRGKIALEEHVSTPENNRLWDSSGEINYGYRYICL